ncbi:MAG: hypothetical protein B7Z55_11640, partial [Planctomycetales bacterium 12-60-4]
MNGWRATVDGTCASRYGTGIVPVEAPSKETLMSSRLRALPVVLLLTLVDAVDAEWQPKPAPLMTRWAKDVSPEKVHPEYPRPQMVRENWLNLNGLWNYAITPKGDAKPQAWEEEMLVPFPVESALSGVMKPVGSDKKLWYRRT